MIVGREPFLGIAFVKETPSLRFGRVGILHTSNGPFTATKNTRSRVSVMVTRWRRWLRCGVPCGKRMHPPHQQSYHRTKKSTSTFVFKSSSVSPKHPWRPRPTPRGRRCLVSTTKPKAQTLWTKSHIQGCRWEEARTKGEPNTGARMGGKHLQGECKWDDLEEGRRREEHGGWTSARNIKRQRHGGVRELYILAECDTI